MDEKKPVSLKKSRSVGDMIDHARDYVKIAKIVVKMSEEERCDFFDWWQYERHVEKNIAAAAKRGFRDFARKVGVMD